MAAEGLCSLLPCVSPATKGFGAAAIRGGQEGVLRRKLWSVRAKGANTCHDLRARYGLEISGNCVLSFYPVLPTLNHPKPTPLRFFSSPGPLSCHHIITKFTHLRDSSSRLCCFLWCFVELHNPNINSSDHSTSNSGGREASSIKRG